jgi:hypothetical protein
MTRKLRTTIKKVKFADNALKAYLLLRRHSRTVSDWQKSELRRERIIPRLMISERRGSRNIPWLVISDNHYVRIILLADANGLKTLRGKLQTHVEPRFVRKVYAWKQCVPLPLRGDSTIKKH